MSPKMLKYSSVADPANQAVFSAQINPIKHFLSVLSLLFPDWFLNIQDNTKKNLLNAILSQLSFLSHSFLSKCLIFLKLDKFTKTEYIPMKYENLDFLNIGESKTKFLNTFLSQLSFTQLSLQNC